MISLDQLLIRPVPGALQWPVFVYRFVSSKSSVFFHERTGDLLPCGLVACRFREPSGWKIKGASLERLLS